TKRARGCCAHVRVLILEKRDSLAEGYPPDRFGSFPCLAASVQACPNRRERLSCLHAAQCAEPAASHIPVGACQQNRDRLNRSSRPGLGQPFRCPKTDHLAAPRVLDFLIELPSHNPYESVHSAIIPKTAQCANGAAGKDTIIQQVEHGKCSSFVADCA